MTAKQELLNSPDLITRLCAEAVEKQGGVMTLERVCRMREGVEAGIRYACQVMQATLYEAIRPTKT